MPQDTKKRDLTAGATPPGRVARDPRGRTVWQWTEEETSGSTSVLLKFLDNDALALEPTQTVPVPPDARPRATGGESTESTSVVLARLDDGQLGLEPTWTARVPNGLRGGRAAARRRTGGAESEDAWTIDGESAGGGFDPYDHS